MTTVTSPPEQRIVLDSIPWEVYESLLATHRNCSAPRFTYDRGRLEIMNPSSEHEELKHMVELFVVIEIDLTSPSLAKFPIFAQLGVPEVWHYNGRRWQIFGLTGNDCSPQTHSTAFPCLTAESMTRLLDESLTLERPVWLRQVRAWCSLGV